MPQPIKKNILNCNNPKKNKRKKLETTKAARVREIRKKMKGKHEYGTSKLEERFARDFLDRLGIEYVYQYKAESIGRYFDFRLFPDSSGPKVLLEIDGDFYHSYGLIYEQMNPMQKHNKMVDEIKNKWCSRNGVQLIRLWEHDINEHPEKVKEYLKEVLKPYMDGTIENKDKRLRK